MTARAGELVDRLRRYLIVCADHGWPVDWALWGARLEGLAERRGLSAYTLAARRRARVKRDEREG